jgi:hypothetical protein
MPNDSSRQGWGVDSIKSRKVPTAYTHQINLHAKANIQRRYMKSVLSLKAKRAAVTRSIAELIQEIDLVKSLRGCKETRKPKEKDSTIADSDLSKVDNSSKRF